MTKDGDGTLMALECCRSWERASEPALRLSSSRRYRNLMGAHRNTAPNRAHVGGNARRAHN